MKKFIINVILILIFSNIFSQIEYGGEPLSLNKFFQTNAVEEFVLPYYEMKLEDREPDKPLKTGELRKIDIDILSDIEPIETKEYFIYKFNIKSLGTKSISVYFNQFILSENTKIFFYNKTKVLGSYNYRNVLLKNKKDFV